MSKDSLTAQSGAMVDQHGPAFVVAVVAVAGPAPAHKEPVLPGAVRVLSGVRVGLAQVDAAKAKGGRRGRGRIVVVGVGVGVEARAGRAHQLHVGREGLVVVWVHLVVGVAVRRIDVLLVALIEMISDELAVKSV